MSNLLLGTLLRNWIYHRCFLDCRIFNWNKLLWNFFEVNCESLLPVCHDYHLLYEILHFFLDTLNQSPLCLDMTCWNNPEIGFDTNLVKSGGLHNGDIGKNRENKDLGMTKSSVWLELRSRLNPQINGKWKLHYKDNENLNFLVNNNSSYDNLS